MILVKCMLALWLGHPKEKTYGYIIDMLDGERYALNMWETSIGRGATCDITVNYDTVARVQAVFTRRIDGWYIYNIAPKSAIKINGKKIDGKDTVADGDILTLGSMRFRFEVIDDPVQNVGKKRKKNKGNISQAPQRQSPAPQRPVYDIDKNQGINSSASFSDFYSGAKSYTVETPERQEKPSVRKKSSQPRIVNRDTNEAFILCGNEVSIGKGSRCDIRLRSRQSARQHALLVLYEDGWAIEDCSGDKGTYLNGARITSPQLLFNGDIIAMGDERLFFEGGKK